MVSIGGGYCGPKIWEHKTNVDHIYIDCGLTHNDRMLAESEDGGKTFKLVEMGNLNDFVEGEKNYNFIRKGDLKWELWRIIDDETRVQTNFDEFHTLAKIEHEENKKKKYIEDYGNIFLKPSIPWYLFLGVLLAMYVGGIVVFLYKSGMIRVTLNIVKSGVFFVLLLYYFKMIYAYGDYCFRYGLEPPKLLVLINKTYIQPGWLLVSFMCFLPLLPSTANMIFARSNEVLEENKSYLIIWNVSLVLVWVILGVAGASFILKFVNVYRLFY